MAKHHLDTLDIKILNALAVNARTPYLEIAREYGVSGAAVHQRVQRLIAANIIVGSECLIDPAALGYETCAYVGVFLRDPSQYNHVVQELEKIPEVIECHFTTGQYDIFIKLLAKNNDDLLHLLQHRIHTLGVARTETLISFKQVLRRPLPIGNGV